MNRRPSRFTISVCGTVRSSREPPNVAPRGSRPPAICGIHQASPRPAHAALQARAKEPAHERDAALEGAGLRWLRAADRPCGGGPDVLPLGVVVVLDGPARRLLAEPHPPGPLTELRNRQPLRVERPCSR